MRIIGTEQLFQHIFNPGTVIVDVRPVEAYNGWKLRNEVRGGHIRGARSLPVKWTRYLDWVEIVRSKGIQPGQTIVLYGYDPEETKQVAEFFQLTGYKEICLYDHFIDEWSPGPELPMESLENYKHLVYPKWLHTLVSGGSPAEYSGTSYVICHAHYRKQEDYEKGHIPGAVSLDTLMLESPETWNRRSAEELRHALQNLGITKDTTVILYGRFSSPDNNDPFPGSSAGHLGAIRCAFIMMYAGVKDIRVLNGGILSWEEAGYEITTKESKPIPAGHFGTGIPAHPELAVDMRKAKELLNSDTGDLICIRSWQEFVGEVSGYNYIEKKGRIPGAIFGNCGSDAYHMENYRNLDHTIREYHEIEDELAKAGVKQENHNAFYCGTGWRGSEAFFSAWLIGWPRVSLFDGGWFEWSNDPRNPIEAGPPEDITV
ncbi:MAG: thiosulfate sulfurtransferase [Bacteroidales bacterium]|nr:thiosulfate sulfurtransferase [Bacteroidales bacterium]